MFEACSLFASLFFHPLQLLHQTATLHHLTGRENIVLTEEGLLAVGTGPESVCGGGGRTYSACNSLLGLKTKRSLTPTCFKAIQESFFIAWSSYRIFTVYTGSKRVCGGFHEGKKNALSYVT